MSNFSLLIKLSIFYVNRHSTMRPATASEHSGCLNEFCVRSWTNEASRAQEVWALLCKWTVAPLRRRSQVPHPHLGQVSPPNSPIMCQHPSPRWSWRLRQGSNRGPRCSLSSRPNSLSQVSRARNNQLSNSSNSLCKTHWPPWSQRLSNNNKNNFIINCNRSEYQPGSPILTPIWCNTIPLHSVWSNFQVIARNFQFDWFFIDLSPNVFKLWYFIELIAWLLDDCKRNLNYVSPAINMKYN